MNYYDPNCGPCSGKDVVIGIVIGLLIVASVMLGVTYFDQKHAEAKFIQNLSATKMMVSSSDSTVIVDYDRYKQSNEGGLDFSQNWRRENHTLSR